MRTTLFAVLLVVGCASLAQGRPQQQPFIPVLSRSDQQDPSGAFRSTFETANGIHSDETGYLIPTNDGLGQTLAKQGDFSYTSPEGVPVRIVYVANEYGFQPQGDVIPKSVQPIPAVFA